MAIMPRKYTAIIAKSITFNYGSPGANGKRSAASVPHLELHIQHELARSRQVRTGKTVGVAAGDHGVAARIAFGNRKSIGQVGSLHREGHLRRDLIAYAGCDIGRSEEHTSEL